jgi:hypothetical protein
MYMKQSIYEEEIANERKCDTSHQNTYILSQEHITAFHLINQPQLEDVVKPQGGIP